MRRFGSKEWRGEAGPPRQTAVEKPFAPGIVVWEVLRKLAQACEDARRAEERRKEFAASVAREVFSYWRVLGHVRRKLPEQEFEREWRSLEIVARRLDAVLQSQGVRYEDLAGRKVDDALLDLADVQSYIPKEVDQERVVETVVPPVYCGGELVGRGIVIAAAPLRRPEPG